MPIDYLQWMARQEGMDAMQTGARHKDYLGERKSSDDFFDRPSKGQIAMNPCGVDPMSRLA
jgi:hypothetical protein